jgi:Cu2+-exporting ATPase
LESYSCHPIASAFRKIKINHRTDSLPELVLNKGIEANITGQCYRIGSFDFVREFSKNADLASEQGLRYMLDKHIYLADAEQVLAVFYIKDSLKADALLIVKHFKESGLNLHILSGDEPDQVKEVAEHLGFEHSFSNQSPQDKLAYVNNLKLSGAKIMTVGDGLNDAPFLAAGNVRIAMGFGAGLTQEQADAVLLGDKLQALYDILLVKNLLNSRIKQNLSWALIYNFSVIPLAAAGFIPPYLAAFGMSVSSVVVVLNSARAFNTSNINNEKIIAMKNKSTIFDKLGANNRL